MIFNRNNSNFQGEKHKCPTNNGATSKNNIDRAQSPDASEQVITLTFPTIRPKKYARIVSTTNPICFILGAYYSGSIGSNYRC